MTQRAEQRVELRVTEYGGHRLVLGDESYQIFYTSAGLQEWAEYRGLELDDVVQHGVGDLTTLTIPDLRVLLEIGIRGGDRRRTVFSGEKSLTPVKREKILDLAFDVFHLSEILMLCLDAWDLVYRNVAVVRSEAGEDGDPLAPGGEDPSDGPA